MIHREMRLAFVLILVSITSYSYVTGTLNIKEECYPPLGCFSTEPPFGISLQRLLSVTPQSPAKIGTVFKLYTRENKDNPVDLTALQTDDVKVIWSSFQARPVKCLVHGFNGVKSLDPWIRTLKDELLIQGNYNVIIVNWSPGASPPYVQATANTRVVGAQIAYLFKKCIENFGMAPSDFHIIGHSLGSHIAGYAGERLAGLGRITGLDPAGPYFKNTDIRVRLDPSDAQFVDVIHTDGKPLIHLGLGTLQPVGHFDFYPNLGHDMPGCAKHPIRQISDVGLVSGLLKTIVCSHVRAVTYYTESINTQCPFTAYPCNSEEDFLSGKCKSCGTQGCARMGFHCQPSNGKIQKFYLTTSDTKPYCQYHLEISIKLSSWPRFSARGNIVAYVRGTLGVTQSVKASPNSIDLKNDQTIEFTVTNAFNIDKFQSVSLRWDRDILTIFWPNSQKIYVYRVLVYSAETSQSLSFCAQNQAIDHQQTLVIDRQC